MAVYENKASLVLRGRHLESLENPVETPPLLATVSGVASTKTPLIRYFDKGIPAVGIITTKSFQVTPNPGNREPVICEVAPGDFGNSVGLRNPGMEVAIQELSALRASRDMRALLNVSVSASNPDDFITLVRRFEAVADIIELNFSCPHAAAGFGASIGCDLSIAASYMAEIKNAVPRCKALIFVKLTPNVEDIGSIAKAVVEAGADGLVAINTVGPNIHMDPVAKAPILQNKLGGKGGCSGRWVNGRALECIREIRAAVGDAIPLIGMGGVSTGNDVAAMLRAGADAVGIGSAFGKVHQRFWREYTDALVQEAVADVMADHGKKSILPANSSASYIDGTRQMEYRAHTILGVLFHTPNIAVFTLSGTLDCQAGQFAFLWIPGVGEKPFSVAENSPLTFVIKKRGAFTEAMFSLKEGDTLYVRGLYGAKIEQNPTPKALLLAGGTGVAVLPSLARLLKGQGTVMDIYVGTSTSAPAADGKALLEDPLSAFGRFTCIADDGRPGRVLDALGAGLSDVDGLACYVVGPEKFMAIAAKKMVSAGVPTERIYLSMERNTLCGIGMCGECVCGDRLACQWGTFMRYDYLLAEAPELVC
ncbi:MAG: nitronate monooxygenase [Sphaerochaetaceae bacterium]|nr:nitronate monooxygenase [Sphaerochaetaceae bacterium]